MNDSDVLNVIHSWRSDVRRNAEDEEEEEEA